MSKLKPIGSEKLQGMEKINRMLEIAKYNENIPQPVNETSKDAFSFRSVDGIKYDIVKEKLGYVIKQEINESVDYLEPMKNRTYFRSYSQAMKKLNLIIKESNRLAGFDGETPLLGEQKKFILKTPKPKLELPAAPTPDEELPTPAPDMGGMEGETMSEPDMGDMGSMEGDTMSEPDMSGMEDDMMSEPDMGGMEDDMMAEPDMGDEEVSYRQIQKLVGKLGQKLRTLESSEPLDSQQIKYVLNSIISALDLSKLEEDDKDDIVSKFEFEGVEMEDEMMAEPDMGDDMGIEEPTEPVENYGIDKVLDELFTESSVDQVLSRYFKEDKIDKVLKKNKIIRENYVKKSKFSEIDRLSETYEQEIVAKKFAEDNPKYKFIGKTNKGSLVFESGTENYKITNKGIIS